MRRTTPSLLLLAACCLVCAAAAPSSQIRWGDPTTERVLQARYDTRPGGTLRIEVSDADVVLMTGADDEIRFEVFLTTHDIERGRERFASMNFRADGNDDDRVTLTSDPEPRGGWSWSWRRHGRFQVTVEATLPPEYDVDVQTGDGDIAAQALRGRITLRSSDGEISADRLEGIVDVSTSDGDIGLGEVDGERVTIRTSDGDIMLGRVRGATVLIDTSDGDISSDRLAGSSLEATSSDGDIILGAIAGPLLATTTDGSIHVGIERLEGAELRTGDGDITIRAPGEVAATLDLRGESLSFRSQVRFDGTLTRRVMRGDLNGGGPTLQARTGDGTIVLHLADR